MILSTSRLFASLLRPLHVDVVCDIGALNGADSLRFRRALPGADIIAFEANPENFRAMNETRALRDARIELLPYAVTACEGEAEFFVVPVHGPESLARRGMSSLYQRTDSDKRGVAVSVPTRRLDRVLAPRLGETASIALWIDAEGAAFEVLEGARDILPRVRLVHVEVETTACIGAAQKLYPAVAALLAARGFVQIATDSPTSSQQFNALYVRAELPAALQTAVWRSKWRQQFRRWAINLLLAPCPPRIKRYLYRRRHIPAAVPRPS